MISTAEMRSFCDPYIKSGVVKKKENSSWCKALNSIWKVLTFSKKDNFLRRATTLGSGIYMKVGWDYEKTPIEETYLTISHERKHLEFFETYGTVLGYVTYLFLPFPVLLAYGRYAIEREGIVAELLALDRLNGDTIAVLNKYVDALAGRGYYYAWPFKRSVRNDLLDRFLTARRET